MKDRKAKKEARTAASRFLETIPLVMRVVAADLRGCDCSIRPAHFRLLGALARRPRSLGELADLQAVSPATMSNTITTLEGYGWVIRRRSDEDRRVVLAELTPDGREVLVRVHETMLERTARVLEPLSADKRRCLIEGLEILRGVFGQAAPPRPES